MTYDFRNLSPLDFEELVRDLLQAEMGIVMESFAPGRDMGIDFRYSQAGNNLVVQAKHYVQSGIDALRRSARGENSKVMKLSPTRYILATSLSLTPMQKAKICADMPDAPLAASDILGFEDLNNLLGIHPDIVHKHFKLWLASLPVLQRILHSGVYSRTEAEMDLIRKTTERFVHNESVPKAEAILSESGALIISGEPGVGKTTLARMLVWLHAEDKWRISVIDDIKEAFEVSIGDDKHLIFFDDFLGQVALSNDLVRSMDQRFPPFLQRVRSHKNLRFILTTRDYIFRQAQIASGRLDSAAVSASEFVLNVGEYTRSSRAKILYNHLYFSKLERADIDALLADDFFLKIVDHRNFNPRLIEFLTDADYLALDSRPIRKAVEDVLTHPHELWDRVFRLHIGNEARMLLRALFFNGPRPLISNVEQTFLRMMSATNSVIPEHERKPAFNRALRELEGSILTIKAGEVRFSNAGVRDYLGRVLVEDSFLFTALRAVCDYDELNRCRELFERTASTQGEREVLAGEWSAALGRMINASSGSPLQRFEMALDLTSMLGEKHLLNPVLAAIDDLEGIDVDSVNVSHWTAVLEKLASTPLEAALTEEARGKLYSAGLRMLDSRSSLLDLEEVEKVANVLADCQLGSVTEAVHTALREHVDCLEDAIMACDSHHQLDRIQEPFERLMKKYGFQDDSVFDQFRAASSRLNYARWSREGDYREGPVGGRTAPGWDAQDREGSDDQIRSIFDGLKRSEQK